MYLHACLTLCILNTDILTDTLANSEDPDDLVAKMKTIFRERNILKLKKKIDLSPLKIQIVSICMWEGVAQWKSACLQIEGLRVPASTSSQCCVLEQDTLILA